MKTCNACKNRLPDSFFSVDRKAPDGKRRTCKLCDRGSSQDYYQRNSAKVKKRERDRYRKKKK